MNNAELFNDAGTKISAINDHGVTALKTADQTTAISIYAMLFFAGKAGLALQAVADSVLPKPDTTPAAGGYRPGLRAGQVVADVGGGGSSEAPYTGTIQPSQLSEDDWRVFAQNYERMPFYTIFASSPAGQERNADGSSMHQGDLAQPVINVAQYKERNGLLAPWL